MKTDHARRATLDRRDFLARATLGATATALGLAPGFAGATDNSTTPKIAFFVVGDTHYLANKESPSRMDPRSAEICGRLVDTLNGLPGTAIPAEAGGGKVAQVSGLIHAGDIIDTGDKNGRVQEEMQKTEWSAYADDYGLTGSDGRLKMPVYEVFGNHDAPHGTGWALEKIIERNKRRPGVGNVSENGLHYSWDWGPAHFLNVGLIVGTDKQVARKRRYAALDSLDFLIADLREKVGTSGKPVIITHHIDMARYTGPCDPSAPADSKEWDPCDVQAFYKAIQGFNVAGIFYGHTHVRNIFRWDGTSPKAATGLHVFNTDNASHFSGDAQALFYVELHDKQLLVREYQTKDGWKTGLFTPQTWVAPFAT